MVLRSLYFLSQKYSNIPIGSRAKIGMKTSAKKQEKKIAVDVSKRNTALLLNRSTHLHIYIYLCMLFVLLHTLLTNTNRNTWTQSRTSIQRKLRSYAVPNLVTLSY